MLSRPTSPTLDTIIFQCGLSRRATLDVDQVPLERKQKNSLDGLKRKYPSNSYKITSCFCYIHLVHHVQTELVADSKNQRCHTSKLLNIKDRKNKNVKRIFIFFVSPPLKESFLAPVDTFSCTAALPHYAALITNTTLLSRLKH